MLALHAQPGLELGRLLREGGGLLLQGDRDPLVGLGGRDDGGAGADQVGEDEDRDRPEGGEHGDDDHAREYAQRV